MMDTRLELRPIQSEVADTYLPGQRGRRTGVFRTTSGPPPERRSTISGSMMPAIYENNTRMRNLSGGSSGSVASSSGSLDNHFSDTNSVFYGPELSPSFHGSPSTVHPSSRNGPVSQRKFDRSLSDSDNSSSQQQQRSVNSSRYKTELCRPFEESGSCKYGDKCQFAHGMHELRNLARHPKYKTELCRTFHTNGFCPYGPRCHFIHADETKSEPSPKVSRQTRSSSYSGSSSVVNGSSQQSSGSSSPTLSPSGSSDNDFSTFNYQDSNGSQPFNSLTVNINNFCSNNNDVQSLEQKFKEFNLNRANDMFSGNVSGTTPAPGEADIFSKITMFSSEEVPKPTGKPSSTTSTYGMQQGSKLDNYPALVESSWSSCSSNGRSSVWSQRAVEPSSFHQHSPTGSMGSDGSSSDCSGSTESLASSGCRDNPGYLSPLSHWIPSF